jgi:hypothetical protein
MFSFKNKVNKKDDHKRSQIQNPKILEVNLIKEDALISFDWNKNLLVLVLVFFLAGLVMAEISYGLDWWKEQETARRQATLDNISALNQETAKLKNQTGAALAYKEKSAAFSNLLTEHVYWTNFFNWLERNTLSSVRYEGFNGDLSGAYNLTASAPTFADVSWQVKAFLNDPMVQQATVVSASAAKNKNKTSEVIFNIALKVKPEIFKK